MSEMKNATEVKEVLAAIDRVTKEKGTIQPRSAPVAPPAHRSESPQRTPIPEDAPSVEIEDQSDENDGTIFLLWYDNEDAKKFPPGQQQGMYPMKSPMCLAKHVDFHNKDQKQNAIQEIAGIVEMFENDSIEVRGRGKYVIIIGKMIQVEVQKRIVLK